MAISCKYDVRYNFSSFDSIEVEEVEEVVSFDASTGEDEDDEDGDFFCALEDFAVASLVGVDGEVGWESDLGTAEDWSEFLALHCRLRCILLG